MLVNRKRITCAVDDTFNGHLSLIHKQKRMAIILWQEGLSRWERKRLLVDRKNGAIIRWLLFFLSVNKERKNPSSSILNKSISQRQSH